MFGNPISSSNTWLCVIWLHNIGAIRVGLNQAKFRGESDPFKPFASSILVAVPAEMKASWVEGLVNKPVGDLWQWHTLN